MDGCTLESAHNKIRDTDAPLFDEDGKKVIGKFIVMAMSYLSDSVIDIKCSKCKLRHVTKSGDLRHIYQEDKEAMRRDEIINHVAAWSKRCTCHAQMSFEHRITSTLQGTFKDQKLNLKGCEIYTKLSPLIFRYVGEMGFTDPRA